MRIKRDRPLRVDQFSAFHVNRVGLTQAAFPLSISVDETDGIWTVSGTAARICHLVDVLATGAHETAAVLNIGQTSWLDENYQSIRPRDIAQHQGIEVTAKAVTWSAPSESVPNDLLMVNWADLDRFLQGWSPDNIDIVDVERPLSDEEADNLALATNTLDKDTRLLSQIRGSRLFYSGHDDCYFYVETVDASLPARIFTRLLALFAGSALVDDTIEAVEVREPDLSIAENLLSGSSQWVGTVLPSPSRCTASMGFTARSWRLGQPLPTDGPYKVTFDCESSAWATFTTTAGS